MLNSSVVTPSARPPYLDDPRTLSTEKTGDVSPAVDTSFSSPGEPRTAAVRPGAKPPVEDAGLPIDPRRLLWAFRRRWRWIVISALTGLVLGTGVGLLRMHTRYTAEFQLIKRYTPPTLQAGATGEPYKPRQFANSTLASAAESTNVLERVARKSNPPVSATDLKHAVTVKEDKLTDFITMTISDNHSAEATVALAKTWSEEIIDFTREIQSQESHEIRKVIQSQLDANQTELQGIETQLTKLSGGQLLSADTQVESFVHIQEDIDAHYEAARMDLESITSQLSGFKAELLRHTPAAEELRQAKADLNALQSRYTDKNPLVVECLDKIATLEARIKKQQASGTAMDLSDLTNHSGTAVGDQLYMRMVEMENQRGAAERRVADLGKQREMFTKSPEKVSQMMELMQRKAMLHTAQTMLLGRFQEVRIYEDNAPAYYGVFAPADVEHIGKTTRLFKITLLGAGGTVFGTFAAAGVVLLLGVVDGKLRTPGEAAKAAGAPLLAALPGGVRRLPAAEEAAAAKLWTRWLGGQGEARRLRTVWCVGGPGGENDFWRMMLAEAQRLLPGLVVIDGGRTPLPALEVLPQGSLHEWQHGQPFAVVRCAVAGGSLHQMHDLQYFIESRLTEGTEVWLRLDGPAQEPATGVVRAAGSAPLLLVPLHDETTGSFLKEQAGLLRHVGVAPCGVVATNDVLLPAAV